MTIDSLLDRSAGRIRPLPAALLRLAELVAGGAYDAAAASAVIAADPVLTSDVLRLANSAASASAREITEVEDAVVRLGASRILAWLSARRMAPELAAPLPAYGLAGKDLWRHSLMAAFAADRIRTLVRTRGISVPGAAYTAALLHDIGKVILAAGLETAARQKIIALVAGGTVWVEAEKEVLGMTHAEVGAALLARWKLPETLVAAVAWHHAPRPEILDDTVHVANVVARFSGLGLGAEGMAFSGEGASARRLGLSQKDIERVTLEAFTELRQREDHLFSASETAALSEEKSPAPEGTDLLFLVVDDSAVMRRMVIRSLRMAAAKNIRFLEASNGLEALEILGREKVDAAFVDVNMPEMNGEQLLIALRADQRWCELPVIVISTEGSETRQARLRGLGAEFLRKPFTPEQLAAILRQRVPQAVKE